MVSLSRLIASAASWSTSFSSDGSPGFFGAVTANPTASTSSTAAMEQANANSEMPSEPSPSRMATAAPNAAPCEAPRISGETSGFWNVPW